MDTQNVTFIIGRGFFMDSKISRGFSLIELMVTVSLLAILLGVGIPSFKNIIESNDLKMSSTRLKMGISFAKEEARDRGRAVVVRAIGNNWDNGWQVFYKKTGAEVLIKQTEFKSEVNITAVGATSTYFEFDKNGYLVSSPVFTLAIGDSSNGDYQGRELTIIRSGQQTIKYLTGDAHG